MGDDVVRTGVDDLLDYLRDKDKVALQDASTVLNIPAETIQAWVDFLVEEKILGIEYKFTKPFIYLNKEESDVRQRAKLIEHTAVPIGTVKDSYFDRARKKQIPESKIPQLWRTHVLEAIDAKKEYFIEQASKRRVGDPETLWNEYVEDLLARC